MRKTHERLVDRVRVRPGADRMLRSLVVSVAAYGAVFGAASCAAPPIIVATAGASIAQLGGTAYANGVLESAFGDSFETAAAATERVVSTSELELRRRRVRGGYGYFETVDKTNTTVTFRVERRTPRITTVRIRVGTFGNQPFSTLLMQMIERELRPVGAEEIKK